MGLKNTSLIDKSPKGMLRTWRPSCWVVPACYIPSPLQQQEIGPPIFFLFPGFFFAYGIRTVKCMHRMRTGIQDLFPVTNYLLPIKMLVWLQKMGVYLHLPLWCIMLLFQILHFCFSCFLFLYLFIFLSLSSSWRKGLSFNWTNHCISCAFDSSFKNPKEYEFFRVFYVPPWEFW